MSEPGFTEPLPAGTVRDLRAAPLRLRLPFPPSTNQLYATVFKRRVLSAEGKKYKRYVSQRVPVLTPPLEVHESIEIRLKFHYPLLFRNGKRRKLDISNRIKVLEDAIVDALGEDDSAVSTLVITRADTGRDGASWVDVEIRALESNQ